MTILLAIVIGALYGTALFMMLRRSEAGHGLFLEASTGSDDVATMQDPAR